MNSEIWAAKLSHALSNQILPLVIAAVAMLIPAWLLAQLARSSSAEGSEDNYRQAVDQARWPNPKFASTSLVGFRFDHPVTVVIWTQSRWVSTYEQPNPVKVGKDIWVTLVPFLKAFCRAYVQLHQADSDRLAVRLKEHLGLPIEGDYDTFVELSIDPKDNPNRPGLFRPCGDSSLGATTCKPPTVPSASDVWTDLPLGTQINDRAQEWMLRNYDSNYTSEHPYPWTGLGYTFDWAQKDNSEDFERFGETEFVIPKGTMVHFVSKSTTMDYCSSQ